MMLRRLLAGWQTAETAAETAAENSAGVATSGWRRGCDGGRATRVLLCLAMHRIESTLSGDSKALVPLGLCIANQGGGDVGCSDSPRLRAFFIVPAHRMPPYTVPVLCFSSHLFLDWDRACHKPSALAGTGSQSQDRHCKGR